MQTRYALVLLAGTIFGSVAFSAKPAYADLPTIDVAVEFAVKTMNTAITNAITSMQKSLTNAMTDLTNPASLSSLLRSGFTQNANYAKAQIGAQQQLMDGQNASMAGYMSRQRNSEIRDEHIVSPSFCATLDNNQSAVAASAASWKVATSIAQITDPRGEAEPNTPSHLGVAQGISANNALHAGRYCSAGDLEAGLCTTLSANPDGDQRAGSLFGADTLPDNGGVDAANDFATSLIQPIAPAALRGDEMRALSGQDVWAHRRAYNARMSLARSVLNYTIGIQSPSVTLTSAQQQELQAEGQPAATKGSWLQAVSLEIQRKVAGVQWNAMLQSMPPATVQREMATEIAMANYLALQNFRIQLLNANISAAQLAATEEQNFRGSTPMPSPSMASN